MLNFLFRNLAGTVLTILLSITFLYFLAPVFLHAVLWEGFILHLPAWIPLIIAGVVALGAFLRYSDRYNRINAITVTILIIFGLVGGGLTAMASSWRNVQLYRLNHFTERPELLGVSSEQVRFKPLQIAQADIVRKNKASEFTPGRLSPIGSEKGVAYISPLVPQGIINTILMQNQGFLYLDDAGTDEERNRVSKIDTQPFSWGEDMAVFDDIHRRLIRKVGFTRSYPEIYYAPVKKEGKVVEIVGVVPYISYAFRGVFVPQWGGVAIFHADGRIEDLSPDEVKNDPRLLSTRRAFPETLVRQIVHAQRFDTGLIGGWIRRPGKIEIPELPGENQMPYFLPMQDGSYQYVTSVEPDGEGFSIMRIYYVNALTGERTVFRFDTPKMGGKNLVGPAKSLSFIKAIPGYNWHQVSSGGGSGTYLIIEPRPVTPRGSDHLHWMVTITDLEYSREVATAFMDAETNEVFGPFKTRADTFAFLQGATAPTTTESKQSSPTLNAIDDGSQNIRPICEEIAQTYHDYCGNALPR